MAAVYKSIYNNQQQMKEVFRKIDLREERFHDSLVKAHKSFGDDIYKYRHYEYIGRFLRDKFKTRHLLLREVHRALRGLITKQQMEQEKEDMMHEEQTVAGINTIDYVAGHPDSTKPIHVADMIRALDQIANEGYRIQKCHNQEVLVRTDETQPDDVIIDP